MKTAFIIASYKQEKFYRNVRDSLKSFGNIDLSHDWLAASHGIKKENDPLEQQQLLDADIEGIIRADIVILLCPCGNDSLIELGVALAQKTTPILVVHPTSFHLDASHFNHAQIHTYKYSDLWSKTQSAGFIAGIVAGFLHNITRRLSAISTKDNTTPQPHVDYGKKCFGDISPVAPKCKTCGVMYDCYIASAQVLR